MLSQRQGKSRMLQEGSTCWKMPYQHIVETRKKKVSLNCWRNEKNYAAFAWCFSHHQMLIMQKNGYYWSKPQKAHHSPATTLISHLKTARCVSSPWNWYWEDRIIYGHICTPGENRELWNKIQTERIRYKKGIDVIWFVSSHKNCYKIGRLTVLAEECSCVTIIWNKYVLCLRLVILCYMYLLNATIHRKLDLSFLVHSYATSQVGARVKSVRKKKFRSKSYFLISSFS